MAFPQVNDYVIVYTTIKKQCKDEYILMRFLPQVYEFIPVALRTYTNVRWCGSS